MKTQDLRPKFWEMKKKFLPRFLPTVDQLYVVKFLRFLRPIWFVITDLYILTFGIILSLSL